MTWWTHVFPPQVYSVCLRGGPRSASALAGSHTPEPLSARYAAKSRGCCRNVWMPDAWEDLGRSCWLCLLSCSVPAECVAARRGPWMVWAWLEAPEALTSRPQGADVHVILEIRLNAGIRTCVLCLPVWMQLVAKVWMEVEAFPGEEKETRQDFRKPTDQSKTESRDKTTNISKICVQLTSTLMLRGGVNDLTT